MAPNKRWEPPQRPFKSAYKKPFARDYKRHFHGNHTARESERGFALIASLILLPLLIAGLFCFFYSTSIVELRSDLLQSCRIELTQTQSQSSEWIHGLMSLNPLVDLVKKSKKLAATALLIPGVGPLITALAQATLASVSDLRVGISALQGTLLQSLWLNMESGLVKAEQKIAQDLLDYKKRSKDLFQIQTLMVRGNHPHHVSVQADDPKSDLTTYSPKPDFISEQNLNVQWVYRISGLSFFEKRGPIKGLQQQRMGGDWKTNQFIFTDQCSVSNRKEKPWSPLSLVDRPFWRSFL